MWRQAAMLSVAVFRMLCHDKRRKTFALQQFNYCDELKRTERAK